MKFRKVFVSCLALVLALSMALQSAPALAQSKSTESGAGFQGVLASIKKVSLLEGFPPRIRIDGALPPGCTSLIVDKPVVGKPNPDTSITPITIRVRGVWQIGAVCTILPKRFTTTVTIDPFEPTWLQASTWYASILAKGSIRIRSSSTSRPGWIDKEAITSQ